MLHIVRVSDSTPTTRVATRVGLESLHQNDSDSVGVEFFLATPIQNDSLRLPDKKYLMSNNLRA